MDEKEINVLQKNLGHIRNLANVKDISIDSGMPKPDASATAVFGQNQVHVLLKGLLDFEEERKRLRKEIAKLEKDIGISNKKLSNKNFLEKAPPQIVAEVKEKVDELSIKLEKLNQNLNLFKAIN